MVHKANHLTSKDASQGGQQHIKKLVVSVAQEMSVVKIYTRLTVVFFSKLYWLKLRMYDPLRYLLCLAPSFKKKTFFALNYKCLFSLCKNTSLQLFLNLSAEIENFRCHRAGKHNSLKKGVRVFLPFLFIEHIVELSETFNTKRYAIPRSINLCQGQMLNVTGGYRRWPCTGLPINFDKYIWILYLFI